MKINALALSAPEFPFGRLGNSSLSSKDPISLFNTCRYAIQRTRFTESSWSKSNWNTNRTLLRRFFVMMNSYKEEKQLLEQILLSQRPNIIFIGAMTMSFSGAIKCARLAKDVLGEKVLIVLGGRHCNETIYKDPCNDDIASHHKSSPLQLMKTGKIEKLFDLVVSGEGEYIIAEIGELFVKNKELDMTSSELNCYIVNSIECNKVYGDWIIGYTDNNEITTKISKGMPIDRNNFKPIQDLFGISNNNFDVFGDSVTGHAFSDTGNGCIFNCYFCSESSAICGRVKQLDEAYKRLYNQFASTSKILQEDFPDKRKSVFVEDSIFLSGNLKQMEFFFEMLKTAPLELSWGIQLTIDLALNNFDIIKKLRGVGLEYVFIGLETMKPENVGNFSKNTIKENWMSKFETLIELYSKYDLKIGISLLFGLGENQEDRLLLLDNILKYVEKYNNLSSLSFNWAVQHPLKNNTKGEDYDYIDWSVESLDYVNEFMNFGESTERYLLPNVQKISIENLKVLNSKINNLLIKQKNKRR